MNLWILGLSWHVCTIPWCVLIFIYVKEKQTEEEKTLSWHRTTKVVQWSMHSPALLDQWIQYCFLIFRIYEGLFKYHMIIFGPFPDHPIFCMNWSFCSPLSPCDWKDHPTSPDHKIPKQTLVNIQTLILCYTPSPIWINSQFATFLMSDKQKIHISTIPMVYCTK